MSKDKVKIIERLKKKGFITDKDTLNELMALALEKNRKEVENSKKNSIDILKSQDIMSRDNFLNLLSYRLENY
ncbi:hypothetical protein [Aquimarina algicola]|uniref:Uncharacterized protein n=1 Tax=Aquimarina algicola TaxID=2589995 RepID=A0A504JBC4_9FLAO|nr:hypothetical protein [Aquimarina algicola]TPN83860.1 hypothetical protein FHK87_18000 [Aquimarina algicola]